MHKRYEEVVVKNHDALQTLTKETEELRAGKEKLQEQLEIWKFHKIRGEYDRTTMQIITLEESPADIAQKKYLDEATKAIEENKILKEKLNLVKTSGSYPADLTLSAEEYLKGPGEQLEGEIWSDFVWIWKIWSRVVRKSQWTLPYTVNATLNPNRNRYVSVVWPFCRILCYGGLTWL